jgi:hypothetical protein
VIDNGSVKGDSRADTDVVSAGAKMLIMPVEKCTTPGGVNPHRLWKQRRAGMCSGGKTWKRSTSLGDRG